MNNVEKNIQILSIACSDAMQETLKTEYDLVLYKDQINKAIDMRILSLQFEAELKSLADAEHEKVAGKPVFLESHTSVLKEFLRPSLLESDKYKELKRFLKEAEQKLADKGYSVGSFGSKGWKPFTIK